MGESIFSRSAMVSPWFTWMSWSHSDIASLGVAGTVCEKIVLPFCSTSDGDVVGGRPRLAEGAVQVDGAG